MSPEDGAFLELDRERMQALLGLLDERLRARDVAASIYVIGGAAMTLAYGREGMTPDVDALYSHAAVIEEARAIAAEQGLAENWLNSNAAGWVPPRPSWALVKPTRPGLTVHYAPAEHVLAMKLVALRRKDRPDILLLIEQTNMGDASPDMYADLLARVYDGEGLLALMLGIPSDDPQQTRQEALRIGEWAYQFAARLRD